MNQTQIPYSPIYLRLYTLVSIPSLVLTPLVFDVSYQIISDWGLTIVICLFPFALKLAAPRVPLVQAVACSICVVALNYLSGTMLSGGEFILWYLFGKAIEIVCVLGFGYYWVYKNYVPAWANKW